MDPCKNLRSLLKSICLRRTSQNHSKLTATYELVKIRLSNAEIEKHERTLDQFKANMDMVVSTGQQGQKFTKLFAVILKLRMLCNHGVYSEQLGSSPHHSTTSLISSIQLGNDTGCDVCHDQEYSGLIMNLEICPVCARLLQSSLSDSDGTIEAPRRKRLKLSSCSLKSTIGDKTALASSSTKPPYEFGTLLAKYPTKLLTVAKNLEENGLSSKRSDNTSFLLIF